MAKAKPRKTRAPHPEGCTCVVCQPPRQGRSTKVVRLPAELVDWADERGGVASVLREAYDLRPSPPHMWAVPPGERARRRLPEPAPPVERAEQGDQAEEDDGADGDAHGAR